MQDVGGADSGPDTDSDADSDVDSDTDSDADFEAYGYVNLSQRTEDVVEGGRLTLSAAFYEVAHDPTADSWVETRTTPDGVECDIYYVSGLPPDPDPPDPPPAQIDGGAIKVGNEGVTPDVLYVEFEDEAYTTDYRTQWDWQHPIPDWLVPASFFVEISGEGQGPVSEFAEQLLVSHIPEMAEEAPQPVDDNGNYVFEWNDHGAEEVVFSMHFNMDWDDASFVCRLDQGVEQILIPQAWTEEYSWGGGEIALYSLDQLEIAAGGGLVLLNVTRAHTVQLYTASD